MILNDKEIQSVIKLEPLKRYQYFLKKIADHEKMFALKDEEGNYALSSIDNHILLPLWPFMQYATLAKRNPEWEQYSISEITLNDFKSQLIPLIEANRYLINVFPVGDTTGFILDLEEFNRDLDVELEKYE